MKTKNEKPGQPSPALHETIDGGKSTPSSAPRKRITFTLDEESVEALNRAAYYLRLSRSEVVQRLAHLADGAVFWGVQLLPADADPETLRCAAKRACDQWGLFVFGDEPLWTGKLPPEPLRVIRGGRP